MLIDELEAQATNFWIDRIKLTSDYELTGFYRRAPYENLANFISDTRRGGRWWERPWYFSLPAEKGGAPEPRVYDMDHVAIDLWLFEVNSKMKIRAKEFSFSLSSTSENSWQLRVRPSLTLGLPYGVKSASFSLLFEYYMGRKKTISIEIFASYRDGKAMAEFQIRLLRF